MREPSFLDLQIEIETAQSLGKSTSASYAKFRHPNPRFYKYRWWVFWAGSSCDGWGFLAPENGLGDKEAWELMAKLTRQDQVFWLYNKQWPRLDSTNPFDPKAAKWKGVEWAQAYDEDPDLPDPRGYK